MLSQNYPNLEYIILDGGSADGSAELIKKYEKYLAYWRSAKDNGAYAAVNEGLQRSTGEIMGWLNSDDMLHLHGLDSVAHVMSNRPDIEFLTGRRIGFDKRGNIQSFGFELQRWCRDFLINSKNLDRPLTTIMQEGTFWRRSLWNKAGGSLDLSFTLAGDYELWARFLRHAPIHTVDANLGGFREHSDAQRSKLFRDQYIQECQNVIRREAVEWTERRTFYGTFPPIVTVPIKNEETEPAPVSAKRSNAAPEYVPRPVNGPKFSVVTVVSNNEDTLDECMDSVLSQRTAGLEYIVVDMESTDRSLEIVQKYGKYLHSFSSFKRVDFYAALNHGLSQSTGHICASLDPTAHYFPMAFAHVIDAFNRSPSIAWLTGFPCALNDSGKLFWTMSRLPLYSREQTIFSEWGGVPIFRESVFWTRPLWSTIGAKLDLRWKYAGDYDLWRRFFRHAQLYSLGRAIAGSRQNSGYNSNIDAPRYFRETYLIRDEEKTAFEQGEFKYFPPAPAPLL